MSYRVREAFETLQGEGINVGRAAVFCRFTGCNLWNGHEAQRSQATCRFCDTVFVGTDGPGGGVFESAELLAAHLRDLWSGPPSSTAFIVCTGGEPLLQLDGDLIDALHDRDVQIAVETNGTIPVPADLDWVCVSPKAGADLVALAGDELKLVFPQPGAEPARYEDMASRGLLDFDHWLLQPMAGPDVAGATEAAIAYCRRHPRWRLSLQTHKYLGIP